MTIELIAVNKELNHQPFFSPITYRFDNQVYQIVGENGSGKSLLLKIIARLDRQISGKLTRDDELPTLFLTDKGIGFNQLTIQENILNAAYILGITITEEQMGTLFQENLSVLDDAYETASLGTQMKVGLTLLFSRDYFGLIVLDEALNGVDHLTQNKVKDRLHELADQGHQPIFFVSHVIDLSVSMPFKEIEIKEFKHAE